MSIITVIVLIIMIELHEIPKNRCTSLPIEQASSTDSNLGIPFDNGMTDFSDPGYNYLGEMLASRGMIVASVDGNFLNGNLWDIAG